MHWAVRLCFWKLTLLYCTTITARAEGQKSTREDRVGEWEKGKFKFALLQPPCSSMLNWTPLVGRESSAALLLLPTPHSLVCDWLNSIYFFTRACSYLHKIRLMQTHTPGTGALTKPGSQMFKRYKSLSYGHLPTAIFMLFFLNSIFPSAICRWTAGSMIFIKWCNTNISELHLRKSITTYWQMA